MRHQSVTVDKLKCSKQRQKGHSDSSTTEQSRGGLKRGCTEGGRKGSHFDCHAVAALPFDFDIFQCK